MRENDFYLKPLHQPLADVHQRDIMSGGRAGVVVERGKGGSAGGRGGAMRRTYHLHPAASGTDISGV